MLEFRFHGRGGQGSVTSAELLAITAVADNKFAQAFPSFGPERRGAPVQAFARIDEEQILNRSKVYTPDVVLVLDYTLTQMVNVTTGLKPDGILIVSTGNTPELVREETGWKGRLAIVDGVKIAMTHIKRPINNTVMLGALIKASGCVSMENMKEAVKERFGKIAAVNMAALTEAFETVTISEGE
ncbi:2-oxoacid:acceptor oxidoreductase family protein [Myxococcota bacterium]|nr:2-oxoacid:acceptor oxidoreductase family protein [Myxococcota bacterium]MBU1379598.1 2-oxoacid:acceptor oxidoreductase family protein [Myxococcota bacterium]MBU1496295.1 2-oxoacid:acceptor oxidoreductase family protein [Myxococcota bacterium]